MKTISFNEFRSWALLPAITLACVGVLAAVVNVDAYAQQGTISDVTDIREEGQAASRDAQNQINAIDEETDGLVQTYRTFLNELSTILKYNQQYRDYIVDQGRKEASLRRQITEVATISRDVVPLMGEMLEGYKMFIAEDIPFLAEERQARSEALQALVVDSDISPGEKYRRILEAYQIENDYGRTIEPYSGVLAAGDNGRSARQVDYLRIGRIALFYQTLDQEESGYWDVESKSWKVLDSGYSFALRQGLRMARQEIPPDLLVLPIVAPEDAR